MKDSGDFFVGFILGIMSITLIISLIQTLTDCVVSKKYEALTREQKAEFMQWKRGIND